MGTAVRFEEYDSSLCLTGHAASRMGSRRISHDDVAAVMSYGRCFYVRGAMVYALGHHEAEKCRKDGLRVDRIEGLQVVCSSENETIITAYRNNNLHSLRRRNTRWAPAQAA